MDILSLGKAMKAKKAMKALNDRLGSGVEDIHPDVKTRLEALEAKDPGVTLYNRVGDVEKNTAVNLNKHNLHVNTILNKNKFGLTELAFDDFADASGVDASKSINILHDPIGNKVELGYTSEESTAIPKLFSNTSSDGGRAFSSSTYSDPANSGAYRVFDQNGSTVWHNGNGVGPEFVGYEFPTKIAINRYAIVAPTDHYPKTWTFEGSMDGSNWVVLDSKANYNLPGSLLYTFDIPNQTEYKMYRLYATAVQRTDGFWFSPSTINMHKRVRNETGEIITTAELLTISPQMMTVSFAGNIQNTKTIPVDLTLGTHTNTELVSGKVQLKKADIVNFFASGSYESSIIDLGENFKSLYKLENTFTTPAGTTAKVYVASSQDGVTFTPYTILNSDNTIATPSGRYVKVKVELTSGYVLKEALVNDFLASESAKFQVNDKIVLDGSAKLKTAYSSQMVADTSYAETGSLLKVPINKEIYKSIEKVEVV
jgi:hypothetical protein